MNNDLSYKNYFTVSHLHNEKREKVWPVVARYIQKKFVPENARVLDLGAGYGVFINNIRAAEKYAVDRSEVLKRNAEKDVHVFIQNATSLANFKSNFFDVVFASNFLEHLERAEIEAILPEIRRVLKPGGRLILLQPNFTYMHKHYFDDYTHKQVFSHVSLTDILRAFDFSIEKMYPKFLPYSMRSRLPTAPWMIEWYLRSPLKPFAGQMLVVANK